MPDDLASFERFVLAQSPAMQPWTPVRDYSEAERARIEGPHVERIREAFQPTRVIDVGCGPGHLVRWLRQAGIEAEGMDLHPPDGEYFWQGNIAWHTAYRSLATRPDLVICREVLEHLTVRDLTLAVRHLVVSTSRFVYVTTRFADGYDQRTIFAADAQDGLDPTHITRLHPDLLRLLFVLEGCKQRADLEAIVDWKGLKRCLVYERV